MSRAAVAGKLGIPHDHSGGVDRWCVVGKGRLRVAYGGASEQALVIQTSSRGHSARGVARGDRARRAHRRIELERVFKVASTRVFEARVVSGRRLLVGIAAHRVRWLTIAAVMGDGELRRVLRRMR